MWEAFLPPPFPLVDVLPIGGDQRGVDCTASSGHQIATSRHDACSKRRHMPFKYLGPTLRRPKAVLPIPGPLWFRQAPCIPG